MLKAVTIIRCQVGLCHTPTQRLCMSCGKPVCYECSTEELADMTLQATGLFCNDCWKDLFEYERFHAIRTEALKDVCAVGQGLMSFEQCISYAQQFLDTVNLTTAQQASIIEALKQEVLTCVVEADNKLRYILQTEEAARVLLAEDDIPYEGGF